MLAATFLAIFFVPLFYRGDHRAPAHRAAQPRRAARARSSTCARARAPRAAHAGPSAGARSRRLSDGARTRETRSCDRGTRGRARRLHDDANRAAGRRAARTDRDGTSRSRALVDAHSTSPALTALIDEALANNLDLQAAMARIDAARAQVTLAQAKPLSERSMSASTPAASRVSRVGSDCRFRPVSPPTGNDYRIGLNASYELDLWGKYRAATRAAQNDLLATRVSRARRCAQSSRRKSRARISACSRPTRSSRCCATR